MYLKQRDNYFICLLMVFFVAISCFAVASNRRQSQQMNNPSQFSNIGQTRNVMNDQIISNSFDQKLKLPKSNLGLNSHFRTIVKPPTSSNFNTVKTLVPYEDLYKVLQQDVGKYFILPITEFERLQKIKKDWLKAQDSPLPEISPIEFRINSARFTGEILENFARIQATFKVETFTAGWHRIPLMWGNMAIESASINGTSTSLHNSWLNAGTNRQFTFGKIQRKNSFQNYYQNNNASNDILSQNNWKDAIFSLPVKGAGKHSCKVSFMVPVQNNDDLYTMRFSLSRIPITFLKITAQDFVLSIDSTNFKDYAVEADDNKSTGCNFIGWLGAESNLYIKWRKKFVKSKAKEAKIKEKTEERIKEHIEKTAEDKLIIASSSVETIKHEEIEPIIQPLVYCRAHTLVSLDETAIYGYKSVQYTISKAPVSSFTYVIPENVEITAVDADRPHTHRLIRDGNKKLLRISFLAGREDNCRIELTYEAPVDLNKKLIDVPEIYPVNIERELGSIAIEALTSVEVQPGNDEENSLGNGVYPIDSSEVSQTLKAKASRPILQAYRYNSRPANISLKIKKYKDVAQQTVVADRMEAKTTFTTNKTSNTLLELNIRNNNKQYLQLQLASGSEVVSAFRDGKPVKIVASKNNGKVQIPLKMSQIIGSPIDMKLQLLLKEKTSSMKWRGAMKFKLPLVDIPVSRFSWHLYAPEQYKLFNFKGTVKSNFPIKDPFFFRGFLRLLDLIQKVMFSPDLLIMSILGFFILLLIVSRKALMKLITGMWEGVAGVFRYLFMGKGINLISLAIVVCIIGILAAIATPNFRKARTQAREKACYANMRVLAGAIEMYNMDNENMMTHLDVGKLLKGKYLRKEPQRPSKGCRYSTLGNMADEGTLQCAVHGTVESDLPESFSHSRGENKAVNFARESVQSHMMKSKKYNVKADSRMKRTYSSKPTNKGFGNTKAKGILPIKSKFVKTTNFYSLERDLIISSVASNGKLLYNRTCPQLDVKYLDTTVLKIIGVASFILALFSGLYFASGAFFKSTSKVTFAAIIILIISILDFNLGTIGDNANYGLWIAIFGALIWKTVWLFSKVKFDELIGSSATRPDIGEKSSKMNYKNNTQHKSETNKHVEPSLKGHDDVVISSKPKIPNPKDDKSGRVDLNFIFVMLFVVLLGATLPAFSIEKEREIRVMSPFKDLAKVLPSGDRVVIIPEADYRYLKDVKVEEQPEIRAPYSFRFLSAHYTGKLEKTGARLRAMFKINLLNNGWKTIKLLSSEAVPTSAIINDTPLALTLIESHPAFYGFMTNATGTVNVEVSFFVPASSSEFRHTSKFLLQTVPVCLTTIDIKVDEEDCDAWIDPGFLLPAIKNNSTTTFKAILPPTSMIKFELYRNVVEIKKPVAEAKPDPEPDLKKKAPVVIQEKTRVNVKETNLLYFNEGFVSGINSFKLKINGGSGIATFAFEVPSRLRILKVENRLIEDWKIDNQNMLNIVFKSKIRGATNITVKFEEDIQNLKNESYSVPEIIPMNVEQSFGVLGVGCLNVLEVSVGEIPEGFTPTIAAEFLKSWRGVRPEKTPYAFKFLRHPNKLKLTVTRPEDISQQTAVIDRAEAMSLLNEDGYLLSRIVYEVRNNSQQFLKVRLPKIASVTTELWSTQVAGTAVRAGFDPEFGVYNLPIIRSKVNRGETKSFPVELVYAIKMTEPLKPATKIHLELPQAHLPVSELNWQLYLPDGYEVMREQGNMNRKREPMEQKFLNDSAYFGSMSSYRSVNTSRQIAQKNTRMQSYKTQQTKLVGMSGQLPVKFKIPTTSWSTGFSMLQIEPNGQAPYIDAVLFNPRKGKGNIFQIIMILLGSVAGIALINIFIGVRKYAWFLFFVLQCSIIGSAIYLKIYQADHFAQMGFGAFLTIYLLYKFFAWKPVNSEKLEKSVKAKEKL